MQKPRVADTLKNMGFEENIEEFRTALAEIKAERFADWSIDELCFTHVEAGTFCSLVRKRLNALG